METDNSDLDRYFFEIALEAQAQRIGVLKKSSTSEETKLVVNILENLSAETIENAPAQWKELLHKVDEMPHSERIRAIQSAAEILQPKVSARRSIEETFDPSKNLFQNLSQPVLMSIMELLPPDARAHVAQVNTEGRRTIELWRVQKTEEFLSDTEFQNYLSYFCSTRLDRDHPETFDAMQQELHTFVPAILEAIRGSDLFSDEKKDSLCNHYIDNLIQDKKLLKDLLVAAYKLSLVNLTSEMPFSIDVTNLKTLDQKFTVIKEEMQRNPEKFEEIVAVDKSIFCIPGEIYTLRNLKLLIMDRSHIRIISPQIERFQFLQRLKISQSKLSFLPKEIGRLPALGTLELNGNLLVSLPAEIGELSALQNLDLSDNHLSSLPVTIGNLRALTYLILSNNNLSNLPIEIGNLQALITLFLNGNKLTVIPEEIRFLSSLKTLNLDSNWLTFLPPEIWNLQALIHLILSNNQLTFLSPKIGSLKKLSALDLEGNQISALPEEIGSLEELQVLILSRNTFSSLPIELTRCEDLFVLRIDRNLAQSLPTEIMQMQGLEIVDWDASIPGGMRISFQ